METLPLFDQGFYTAKGWELPNPELENNQEYMDGWWCGAGEQMEQYPFPYSDISVNQQQSDR